MKLELVRRAQEHGAIINFYKTDLPVEDEDLTILTAEIKRSLREPLQLGDSGQVVLLADMKTATYQVLIIEPIKTPMIGRLRRYFEI